MKTNLPAVISKEPQSPAFCKGDVGSRFDPLFTIFCLTKEIKKSVDKIRYFTHHLERCKKESDTIKLTIILIVEIAYVVSLISSLNKISGDVVSNLLPTVGALRSSP